MPRGVKKKGNDAPMINPIGRRSKRGQSKAIELANESDDDVASVGTPTPGARSKARLTLSQPNPTSSQPGPQGSKPKVSSLLSTKQQTAAPTEQILVIKSDEDVPNESGEEPSSGEAAIGPVMQEAEKYYYSVFLKVNYDTDCTIFEHTRIAASVGPNRFDYGSHYEIAVAKAKAYAETILGINPPCFFVSAIAMIKWTRSAKAEQMVFTIETQDSAAWTNIETAIEIRHLSGKKDIIVALDFRFGRTPSGAPPPKPPSMAELARQAKADKIAKDAKKLTDFEEKTVEALDRKKALLMEKWLCSKPTCPNSIGWCWIRLSDSAHLKVDRAHFVVWNTAIEKGNGSATVERPPKEIHALLPRQEKRGLLEPIEMGGNLLILAMMDERSERSDRRRLEEKREQEQALARVTQVGMTPMYASPSIYGSSPFTQPYTYATPPGFMPPTYPFPYTSMAMPVDTSTQSSAATPRSRTFSTLPDAEPIRPSSPVEGNNIDDYVQWHLKKKGADEEGFIEAARLLRKDGYDLQTVQNKKRGVEWMTALGIKEGIAIQLQRDMTLFGKSQKQQESIAVLSTPASKEASVLPLRSSSVVPHQADDSTIDTQPVNSNGIDEYPHSGTDSTKDYDSDDLDQPFSMSNIPDDATATQVFRVLKAGMPTSQDFHVPGVTLPR